MANVLVTVTVNGTVTSGKEDYGQKVSYNQLKAALKDQYAHLESFKLQASGGCNQLPGDDSLPAGDYVATITTATIAQAQRAPMMPYGTRPGWRSGDSWSHGATSVPRQFRFWPKHAHDLVESGWWIRSFWPFTPSKPSMPMGGTTTDILSSAPSSPSSSAEGSPSCAEGSPSCAEGSPSSSEITLSISPRDSQSSTEAADIISSTSLSALELSCSSSGCLGNDLAMMPAVGIRKRKPGGD